MTVWMLLLLGCPVVTETYQASLRDRDEDGFDAVGFGGLDCDDDDPAIHPLAEEVWYDGIDDNCDGNDADQDEDGVLGGGLGADCDDLDPELDDQLIERFVDADGDGFGSGQAMVCPNAEGHVAVGGDCDDTDDRVNPGAAETWYDGIDDDCDGNDDDQDGDGYPGGDQGSDCDDTDDAVGDTLTWWTDDDGDGFGDATKPIEGGGCSPDDGQVGNDLDCDDLDAGIHPDALEVCDDFDRDEDCDGLSDDLDDQGPEPGNQSFFYVDFDNDGFGVGKAMLQCDGGSGLSSVDGDCNDASDIEYPGALRYLDRDGDDYGRDEDVVASCFTITGRVSQGGDCNDRNANIHPGVLPEDDEPYDFVDWDCAGDTDVDTTMPGNYPRPIGTWSQAPDWHTAPAPCPGSQTALHVGPGETYGDIQSALDDASECDIIVVHAGSYAPFTVATDGVVVTANPGEEVSIWGGNRVEVEAQDVLLAELHIQQTTGGINIQGSAFLDRITMTDNLTNIAADGDLLAYELHVTGGVGGLARNSSGNLRIVNSTFTDVLGLFGAVQSSDADGRVELTNVAVIESTGGIFETVFIQAERIDVDGLVLEAGAGPALRIEATESTVERLVLRDNVVFDQPLAKIVPSGWDFFLGLGDRAVVHDVLVTGNSWVLGENASDPGFFIVDDFEEAFVDDVRMVANTLDLTDAPISTRPVWLQSVNRGLFAGTGDRALHHVLIAGYDPYGTGAPTGVGVKAEGGKLRNATLVGLDAGVVSLPGQAGQELRLFGSILWDVDQLFLLDDGGIAPGFQDCASNHGDCTGCATSDPGFLRYHELLPADLWDLRLFRDSPYYRFGESTGTPPTTCSFNDFNATTPTEEQLGAFGDHNIDSSHYALAGGELDEADLQADNYVYADCNEDDVYDSWAAQFRAIEATDDQDGDDVLNGDEFAQGTLPDEVDTDDDGADDLYDSAKLDPTVQ